jgi:hypothetical protein
VQQQFLNSTKTLTTVRVLLLVIAMFVGPVHLTLFAQGDCNKVNGAGSYVAHGIRWAAQCSNSGFQNRCKWINCNATITCSRCTGTPSYTCGPGQYYGDAFNDNCFVGFPDALCGCDYQTCCSGRTGA